MSPSRLPRPANDTRLAQSFATATRRGYVIGEMLRAAHGRVGHRSAKTGGRAMTHRELLDMRITAYLAALVETGEHGAGEQLVKAMERLVATLPDDVRCRAARRLAEVKRGAPMRDLAALKRSLEERRCPGFEADGNSQFCRHCGRVQQAHRWTIDDSGPPSGPRMLLAADRRYVALRREAMDALSALVGDYGAGCYQIGGKQLPADAARELGDMMRELDVEVMHPSRGNVPRMAREAASIAAVIGVQVSGMREAGKRATAALVRLAAFVDRGGGR